MKLYGYRNGRTLRALWALEEVGAAYEYQEVDLFKGEARESWFLKLNPAGKVPVLVDGALVVTESAAICLHVADKFPGAALVPPVGSSARADCYKWISFIITELDSALWTIAKHRFVLPKDKRVDAALDTAAWEYGQAAKILAAAVDDRPYLVGDAFTLADILAAHVLLWAKSSRLEFKSAPLEAYLKRLQQRVAFARAQQRAAVTFPVK